MNPSRFIAFYDAMLAIIMTLIVLEFDVPDPTHLFRLISGFVCYGISFFWLGIMWISSYTAWQYLERISPRTLLMMLISLFFSSFFPFATTLMIENFNSKEAQLFYVVVALLITFGNYLLTQSINKDHATPVLKSLFMIPSQMVLFDFGLKIIGLFLCYFVWPPFGMISIFIALLIVTVNFFKDSKIHCVNNCNLESEVENQNKSIEVE